MDRQAIARLLSPVLLGIFLLAFWEFAVRAADIPVFVLPGPLKIFASLVDNFSSLMGSAWATLKITFSAFIVALIAGVGLAIVFSQSRLVELMVYPYAVALQVTPVVAIAPLILIWVGYERIEVALLILATIVAFFPILSATTLGLKSVDHGLRDLFALYGAGRLQTLIKLELPATLPLLLTGMKTSGGLALIGAVVAEFVAGSGTATGLAWRIVEAGNRLDIPKMFAALLLLSMLGIAIFLTLSLLEWVLLRKWHESMVKREN
jgi:NitT/TauT family transport system permease protein